MWVYVYLLYMGFIDSLTEHLTVEIESFFFFLYTLCFLCAYCVYKQFFVFELSLYYIYVCTFMSLKIINFINIFFLCKCI